MRKIVIRIVYFILLLVGALAVFELVSAGRSREATLSMEDPSLPLVYMQKGEVRFNELHGFTSERSPGMDPGSLTPIGSGRSVSVQADPLGEQISSLSYEVRSTSGERLIERGDLSDYQTAEDGTISASFSLKDLISEDRDYVLVLRLGYGEGKQAWYYTRIRWDSDEGENPDWLSALEFVSEFHEKTETGTDTSYVEQFIEPDGSGNGNSLDTVTINSTTEQVMWNELHPEDVSAPVYSLQGVEGDSIWISGWYVNRIEEEDTSDSRYYVCRESYRLRKGFDRFHLIAFERTMDQYFDPSLSSSGDNTVTLGITQGPEDIRRSPDGKTTVFVQGGRIYACSRSAVSCLYAFDTAGNTDRRNAYPLHAVRILDVSDDGDVDFLVCGYMNRGEHEGTVGICEYHYSKADRTIEENLYSSYAGSADILMEQMKQGAYMNSKGLLYLLLDGTLYEANIHNQQVQTPGEDIPTGSIAISESGERIAFPETDAKTGESTGSIILEDLSDLSRMEISPDEGENLIPVGFIGEDLVYGTAREDDSFVDSSGISVTPMYSVKIAQQGEDGPAILEDYEEKGFYITQAVIEGSQIILHRVQKNEDGTWLAAPDDEIVSAGLESEASSVGEQSLDGYGTVKTVSISGFDMDSIRYTQPREKELSESREVSLESSEQAQIFFVYDYTGFDRFFYNVSEAVSRADGEHGKVLDAQGRTVWGQIGLERCEIDGIGEGADYSALLKQGDIGRAAACLDAMMQYSGVSAETESLLSSGSTPAQILAGAEGAEALDLSGCSLEEVLYYPSVDIPVLAQTDTGTVLITGYGPENIAYWDPENGESLMTREQARTRLAAGGSRYLTWIPPEQSD